MTDTVLFTDQVTFVIASAIALMFAVLLVSKRIEQRIGRLELRIRQVMWYDIKIEYMSAVGQKRTCEVHQPMSALPPIATAKADSRKGSCPLYPRKRTFAVQ